MAVVMGNIDLAKRLVKTKDKIFSLPDKTERGADRPYPPLLRTNLLLKAINGKTTLRDLMAQLNIKENEMVEDIKLLFDTQWIKFTPSQETIFKRLKNEL